LGRKYLYTNKYVNATGCLNIILNMQIELNINLSLMICAWQRILATHPLNGNAPHGMSSALAPKACTGWLSDSLIA
jgi:hypothetical protein